MFRGDEYSLAKFFFEFSKGIGPLIRCIPIAEQLRTEGHEILYFGHKEAYKYMDNLKFNRINLEAKETVYTSVERKNDWVNADEYWGGFGFSDESFIRSELENWICEICEFNPDVIISDLGVFSSLVSRIAKIPLVTITQSCYHIRAQNKPQRYWKQCESICTSSIDAINSVLESYNVPRLKSFEDIFVGDITLIPSFPEFDILRKTDNDNDNTYYIGPILWEGVLDKSVKENVGYNADEHVFCYIGQCLDEISETSENILKSIHNIAYEFNIEFIISIENKHTAEHISSKYADENIHICNWLPIEQAYSNSKFIVCHGGHGSCMGLFQYKVPALIIPTHTEREYNARLVEAVGAGISIPYDDITERKMEQAMRRLLLDSKYKDNTVHFNQVINSRYHDGVALAAKYILSLCS